MATPDPSSTRKFYSTAGLAAAMKQEDADPFWAAKSLHQSWAIAPDPNCGGKSGGQNSRVQGSAVRRQVPWGMILRRSDIELVWKLQKDDWVSGITG
jgi:hypothetical protein